MGVNNPSTITTQRVSRDAAAQPASAFHCHVIAEHDSGTCDDGAW